MGFTKINQRKGLAKSQKKLELDRSPSAQYNRLTMSELEEKAKTTEAPLEKRSQSQASILGSTENLQANGFVMKM